MKAITITVLLLAATTAPAVAQVAHPVTIRGFGGVSFMSETGGIFGAGLGVRLGRHLEAIGEVGRLTNILPRQIQRELDQAARLMQPTYGPLSIDASAPAVYTFGGLRTTWTAHTRVAFFVDGGGGVAHGTSAIEARSARSPRRATIRPSGESDTPDALDHPGKAPRSLPVATSQTRTNLFSLSPGSPVRMPNNLMPREMRLLPSDVNVSDAIMVRWPRSSCSILPLARS